MPPSKNIIVSDAYTTYSQNSLKAWSASWDILDLPNAAINKESDTNPNTPEIWTPKWTCSAT